uniref:Uncharacterized protein n=1 Tax=Arundo donax TaxID=35708 RepID=A0A0A9FJZ8_ARUDO
MVASVCGLELGVVVSSVLRGKFDSPPPPFCCAG